MISVYIGLGSNLGDKKQNLEEAIEFLKNYGTVTKCSSFNETEPVGFLDQDWFLNAVLEFETELNPRELLEICQSIEKKFGKNIKIKNGPRTIDLDILLFGDEIIEEDDLVIPHPRMHEREFVLEPMCEIAAGVRHPLLDKTIEELRDNLKVL